MAQLGQAGQAVLSPLVLARSHAPSISPHWGRGPPAKAMLLPFRGAQLQRQGC